VEDLLKEAEPAIASTPDPAKTKNLLHLNRELLELHEPRPGDVDVRRAQSRVRAEVEAREMSTRNEAYHRARLAREKIRGDAYRAADQLSVDATTDADAKLRQAPATRSLSATVTDPEGLYTPQPAEAPIGRVVEIAYDGIKHQVRVDANGRVVAENPVADDGWSTRGTFVGDAEAFMAAKRAGVGLKAGPEEPPSPERLVDDALFRPEVREAYRRPSAVIGSAAEDLMVCRLFCGGRWIRTIGPPVTCELCWRGLSLLPARERERFSFLRASNHSVEPGWGTV